MTLFRIFATAIRHGRNLTTLATTETMFADVLNLIGGNGFSFLSGIINYQLASPVNCYFGF